MPSIILTQSQIKAKVAGATMFLFPININKISINLNEENGLYFNSAYKFECSYCKGKDSQCTDCYGKGYIWDLDCESKEEFIAKYSPIQKGDKDIFVQEEFRVFDEMQRKQNIVWYRSEYPDLNLNGVCDLYNWQEPSQMTKEQSRYSFSECIDIRVLRVQDINAKESYMICGNNVSKEYMFNGGLKFWKYYNQQLKELNISRTYEDNDYVFLIEFA